MTLERLHSDSSESYVVITPDHPDDGFGDKPTAIVDDAVSESAEEPVILPESTAPLVVPISGRIDSSFFDGTEVEPLKSSLAMRASVDSPKIAGGVVRRTIQALTTDIRNLLWPVTSVKKEKGPDASLLSRLNRWPIRLALMMAIGGIESYRSMREMRAIQLDHQHALAAGQTIDDKRRGVVARIKSQAEVLEVCTNTAVELAREELISFLYRNDDDWPFRRNPEDVAGGQFSFFCPRNCEPRYSYDGPSRTYDFLDMPMPQVSEGNVLIQKLPPTHGKPTMRCVMQENPNTFVLYWKMTRQKLSAMHGETLDHPDEKLLNKVRQDIASLISALSETKGDAAKALANELVEKPVENSPYFRVYLNYLSALCTGADFSDSETAQGIQEQIIKAFPSSSKTFFARKLVHALQSMTSGKSLAK